MLVSLAFTFAIACVAVAEKPPYNKKGNRPAAGQQRDGHAVGNPTTAAKPTVTPKQTITGQQSVTGKSKATGRSETTGKSKTTWKSKTTGDPTNTGKHKEARASKGKPATTPVSSDNATDTGGTSGVADKTPTAPDVVSAPAAAPTQQSSVIPIPNQPTQGFAVDPNASQPAQQSSGVPITGQSTQLSVNPNPVQSTQPLSVGPGPNQPTTTSTPLTVKVTQLPTPSFTPFTVPTRTGAPQTTTATIVPITTMSGQAINVDPNANTNQPAQSAVSVTNQQPGTAPTGIQGQVVTGAPASTQTRTPAQISVTGGEQFGIVQPSNFKSVSVTPSYDYPQTLANSEAGGLGKTVQDPINNKTFIPNINQQEFHFDPNALVNEAQPLVTNPDTGLLGGDGRLKSAGNPYEDDTPVYLRR